MKELRFERSYTKDDQRTYRKLPFDVPQGIDRIELEYEYPRFVEVSFPEGKGRREANIIDIGLYDDQGTLYGWSGSQSQKIFVSAAGSSPGYRRGGIRSGQWAAALGLYKIEAALNISVTIRLIPKERRLLRGDLHIHTVNSDGVYTTAQLIEAALIGGLDFIALTDHNTLIQNTEIGNPQRLSVIAGMEYTNYRGHANFYFQSPVPEFKDNLLSNSFDEMSGTFRRAKAAGALISLNHICCDLCPWEFGYTGFDFDMLEVWNGPMKESEIKALSFWHQRLLEGKKISIVSGSDTHRPELGRTVGFPCTFVYADSSGTEDILNALAEGRSFLAFSPQGPIIELTIDGAGLGETALFRAGMTGTFKVSSVKQGDLIKLINRKEAVTMTVSFDGDYEQIFPVEDALFYRLEVHRRLLGRLLPVALSNPVYIQEAC
ncbi:MAG: CehA/McbA family metallohydrolase [Treponema sp.]|jgi:hypothetical protein|nr:CehA/McbA family metallohydrolase [Treponema sp.]